MNKNVRNTAHFTGGILGLITMFGNYFVGREGLMSGGRKRLVLLYEIRVRYLQRISKISGGSAGMPGTDQFQQS